MRKIFVYNIAEVENIKCLKKGNIFHMEPTEKDDSCTPNLYISTTDPYQQDNEGEWKIDASPIMKFSNDEFLIAKKVTE